MNKLMLKATVSGHRSDVPFELTFNKGLKKFEISSIDLREYG